MKSTTPAASPAPTSARAPRADARRNYEALLAAAKVVFARSGVDAPMEEVARRAGVGQGTLYRHFPTREHVFVALLGERVDLLDRTARELLEAPDPWQSLVGWLRLYDQSATEYRGMSTRVAEGLADDASPVAAACAPMKAGFGALFDRARDAGVVRSDISALQVLTMISALPKDPERGTTIELYLDIVLKGLRP
ncbi:TetR/AcrR family transcriptional regulator [Rugosimonospora acidiphila]|uniref:TetR/AcrR family transcriptional regulator n=1 Tax=Rugosimonospora acidiphila TaxID=556531 RepID=A0ABP9SIS5_9ACTN